MLLAKWLNDFSHRFSFSNRKIRKRRILRTAVNSQTAQFTQVSHVESLEVRALLSNAEFDVNTNTLKITFGTNPGETIVINPPATTGDFSVQIYVPSMPGTTQNFVFGPTIRSQMTAISIQEVLGDPPSGNNLIDIQIVSSSLFPALTQIVVNGGDGNDIIQGSQLPDTLNGDSDNDRIFGRAGNDQIDGGSGNDFLNGGLGDDALTGGVGNDVVVGDFGADSLTGGDGDDLLIPARLLDGGSPNPGATTRTEWFGGNDFDTKVANLDGVLLAIPAMTWTPFANGNGQTGVVNAEATVFDDFRTNTLDGGTGRDWYFVSDELLAANADETLPTGKDVVNGFVANTDQRYLAVNPVPTNPVNIRRATTSETNTEPPAFSTTTPTLLSRLSGVPGTTFTAATSPTTTPKEYVWGGATIPEYVTTPSYNINGTLVRLRRSAGIFGGSNEPGTLSKDLIADVSGAAVSLYAPDLPTGSSLWSQNPAESNVQYSFSSQTSEGNTVLGIQKFQVLANTASGIQQLFSPSEMRVISEFQPKLTAGGQLHLGQTSIYYDRDSGHNYTVLLGSPIGSNVVYAYLIDLDADPTSNPVLAKFDVSTLTGLPNELSSATLEDDWEFSPDGKYLIVDYNYTLNANTVNPENIGAYRLLNVTIGATSATSSISNFTMPETPPILSSNGTESSENIAAFRTTDAKNAGFFPFAWHHQVFALGASGKSYVIGQPGKWSRNHLNTNTGVIKYLGELPPASGADNRLIGQIFRFDPMEKERKGQAL